MLGSKLFVIAFAVYLGLSPLFWLPYISPSLMFFLKGSIFIFISVYSVIFFFQKSGFFKLKFPGGKTVFILLMSMLLTLVPYATLGENARNIVTMINIVQIIFFLIASRVVIEFKKVYFVLKTSLWILSAFVIFSVFLMLTNPFIINPFNDNLFLINTGFGGMRTGWTPSIGLFVPFLLMFSGSLVLLVMYLMSQLLTGGRAGFYLSLLTIPIVLYLEKNWKINLRFIFTLGGTILIIFLYFPSLLDSFRVFDLLTKSNSYDDLNAVSSGRIVLLLNAWNSIVESPILGHGLSDSFLGEGVHNVFVKNWVYYGVIYFLLSIAVVIYIFVKSLMKIRGSNNFLDKKFFSVIFLVLSTGFFLGMVEPSIIFGNFNTFSIWWFCFALVASNKFLLTNESFVHGK